MANNIEIFISYADEDEDFLKELESHLKPLAGTYPITIWHRKKVIPGQEQQREIDKHLKAARIILLLVSPSYLASDDPYNHEMPQAMQRRKTDGAHVIPVLLRSVYWEDAPFATLGPLPTNRLSVRQWRDRDEAFQDIALGIRRVVKDLVAQPQAVIPSPPTDEKNTTEEAAMHHQPSVQKDTEFDVFLCHNTVDKADVKEIAKELSTRQIRPWLDEWELRPGLPWQRLLEEQITQIKAAAVFVGSSGIGPWQREELDAFLREFKKRGCPVIPVLLKTASREPTLPVFLQGMTWVNFRKQIPDPMEQLIWGITGNNPHYQALRGGQQSQGQTSTPTPTGSTDGQRQKRDETQGPQNLQNEKVQHSEQYDVFLSYAEVDAQWVEDLATRLEDDAGFRVWLDKWLLIPGQSSQQAIARGLDQAKSCAVCIGEHTPIGWFREEIERALNRQTRDPSFRVIPVLLPNAKAVNVNNFLELRTWVDFRGPDPAYAFHALVCGVKGIPPGRWPPKK